MQVRRPREMWPTEWCKCGAGENWVSIRGLGHCGKRICSRVGAVLQLFFDLWLEMRACLSLLVVACRRWTQPSTIPRKGKIRPYQRNNIPWTSLSSEYAASHNFASFSAMHYQKRPYLSQSRGRVITGQGSDSSVSKPLIKSRTLYGSARSPYLRMSFAWSLPRPPFHNSCLTATPLNTNCITRLNRTTNRPVARKPWVNSCHSVCAARSWC
jgi:hypothetical protein